MEHCNPRTIVTYPPKLSKPKVDENTGFQVRVSWEEPICNILSYQILWRYIDVSGESSSEHKEISRLPHYTLCNLRSGCRYVLAIAAVNKSGEGQCSDAVTFTAAPLPPCNVEICKVTETSISVKFCHKDPEQQRFLVDLTCLSDGENSKKNIEGCFAFINDLTPGEAYNLMIYAIRGEIKSSPTKSITVNTYPEKVRNICTKQSTCNSQSISWNRVDGATLYSIIWKEEGRNYQSTSTQHTNIELQNLELGQRYTVSVAAFNNAGHGQYSDPVDFTTDLAPPESVIVTNAKNQPESSIHVQIMQHETKPAKYKITMEAVTSADTFEKIISGNTACINDLKPGTQYIAHVCSYDEGDKDRISEISELRTSSEPIWTYPSQVQDLAVAIVNTTSCKISWKPVKGATLYEIKWKKSTDKKYKVQDTGTVTEISLVHLDLNTFYSALVTAVNSAGHGKPSTVTTFQTGLHPPSNLQVKNSELDKQTSIDVEFTEPEQRANKYGIRVVQKEGKFKDITHETGYNWATISGLNSGECYRVYVYSIHDKDKKLNSSEISSELIRTALGRIKLTTTKVSATRQKLEWSGQPSAKQYLVKWGIEHSESKEFSTKEPNCILENLSPGQTYVASASAVNDTGIGEESEIMKFTTVPSTPQNLQYKLISTDVTTLTFDSCHGATNYKVKISSAEDGSQIDEEMTTLPQYRFKYQGSCVKFQVEIEAQNSAGSSKPSKALEFKQILRHLHVKSSKQAMHDQPQQSFIPPLIRKIPSGQSEVFEDFIRPDPGEVVLLVGDQFYGKSASCAYYIQRYQTENLVVMMDYDKVRDSTQKMDIQTLLHKYMTDLTTAEMDITFQWMKENSKQVSFVIDNASFPKYFHEKQCSYEDKEDVSVLLYNITRRHRDIFPESQIFCTTSQDSIQGIMKPSRAATIVGFKENHLRQMQKQIFNDKDVPDMPFHVQELCAIPSFCKIIIQLYANNTANINLSSVSAVLAEVLLRILSSNSDDVNKAKLSQLYNRMNEFSDKIDIKKISHGKVKPVKGKKARKLEAIDETASSVYTQMTEREDDYTDIVGETYVKALYTAIAMGASEFEQFFNNKEKLDISRHSKLWIMAAGLFRSDTLEKISRVFSPVFPIIAKNAEKKKGILKKFITGNMVSIQSQVYQNHDITLAWLMCCAEMQDETLQRKCFAEIKIKNDMSPTAVQQVSTFLENLPMVICRMVKLKIKHNIKPAINAEIDAALRHNPYGKMIKTESYKSASTFSKQASLRYEAANALEVSCNESKLIVSLPDNCVDDYNGEYRYLAQSLLDGGKFNSSFTTERKAVIENIKPGDNYKVMARQRQDEKDIACTHIQTYKTITQKGGELNVGGCSIIFQEETFTDHSKISISHLSEIEPPTGYSSISHIYKLHSTNDSFHKEMSCTITTWCQASTDAEIFTYENNKWNPVHIARLENSKIEFQCWQLGVFGVFVVANEARLKIQKPEPVTSNANNKLPRLSVEQPTSS